MITALPCRPVSRGAPRLLLVLLLWLAPEALPAQDGSSKASPTPNSATEFAQAADEVLHNMSEITGLSLVSPLKKTLRSRDDIRAYVIARANADKHKPAEDGGE